MDEQVTRFLETQERWQPELYLLRGLILECGLLETYKWKQPCYTYLNKNVVIIGGYKDFCIMAFMKGALLGDSEGILSLPGENTNAGRVFRCTSVGEIMQYREVLKTYIFEAIEVERLGLQIPSKSVSDYIVPPELTQKMDTNTDFKIAFEGLTPSRKKAYLMHFGEAKQSSTRTSRIENCSPRILMGKGLQDCICGLSKRMPRCDGSHSKPK
jgi:uncharacterized protein YdeI (YjbR/CyaY-like superfamily)